LHAAGGTKNALCAPQATQKWHSPPSTMTKYLTKYLTKICDYKGTRKNGQMKTTYLVEIVVLHAAGAAK
jgi:hypothetical protein